MARRKKTQITETITLENAGLLMSEYAKHEAEEKKIIATMEGQIARIREKYREKLEEIDKEKTTLFDRLEHFAKTNGDKFLTKKSIELVHGIIGFRTGTPKVKARSGFTLKAALELVKVKLPDYVRTKEEINRDKMIADRNNENMVSKMTECGLQITKDESFYVNPKEEAPATS